MELVSTDLSLLRSELESLETDPEIECFTTELEPVIQIERPIHTFDFEEVRRGNICLVIREFRGNADEAKIVIHKDEIEQFYLDFHKSIKSGNWQKHLKTYRISDIRKQYPRAYEEWTDDEEICLREMFEEKRKIVDIAHHLKRQPGAIRSRLSKLSLHK